MRSGARGRDMAPGGAGMEWSINVLGGGKGRAYERGGLEMGDF